MENSEVKTSNSIKKIALAATAILLAAVLAVNLAGGAKGRTVKIFKEIIDEETKLTADLRKDFPYVDKLYGIRADSSQWDISLGVLSASENADSFANKLLEQMQLGMLLKNDRANSISCADVSLYFKGSRILNFESFASDDMVTFDFPGISEDVYCIKNPNDLSEESDDRMRFEDAGKLVKSAFIINRTSKAVPVDDNFGKGLSSAFITALNKSDYESLEDGSIEILVGSEHIRNILAEAGSHTDFNLLLKLFFEDENADMENMSVSDGVINIRLDEEKKPYSADAEFSISYEDENEGGKALVFRLKRDPQKAYTLSILSDDGSEAVFSVSRSYEEGTYKIAVSTELSDQTEKSSAKLLLDLYKDRGEENAFITLEQRVFDDTEVMTGRKYEGAATVFSSEDSVTIDMPEGNVYALLKEKEIPIYKISFSSEADAMTEALEMPEAIDVKQLSEQQAAELSAKIAAGLAKSILTAALS